jgi:O-antigen ligase
LLFVFIEIPAQLNAALQKIIIKALPSIMFSFQTFKLKLKNNTDIIYYLLLFFAAFLPFQFALNPSLGFDLAIVRVFIPLLFIFWMLLGLKNKSILLERGKTTYLIAAFLLLAILSLSFSHNLFWSLRKLLFLLSIFPLYFVAATVLNTANKQRTMTVALVGGATTLAILSLFQFVAQFIFGIDPVYVFLAHHITPFFLGNSFSQAVLSYPSWLVNANGVTYMRATAMFPDPHMLSYYFGILIPWSIALWSTSKKHSLFFLLASIALILADIATFTRGGYLALIAGALIILPLVSRKSVLKIITAAFIVFFLFTLAPHSPVAGRLTSSFDITEGSNQGRIYNWKQALPIIAKHPLGVGIGMYPLAVKSEADYREPIYAHNLYLDIAAELGIAAALVFILILLFTFSSFWKAAQQQPFFTAGVSSVTIFAIHSLVETPLYSVHILSLICILIAMSVAAKHYEKN